MARYKSDINTIYISERMQESLRQIASCKFTTVTAPMGYGKTVAVNWFLEERRAAGDKVVCISVYSSSPVLFWKRFQAAFRGTPVEEALSHMDIPLDRAALAMLKSVLEDYFAQCSQEHYVFVDDYHLLEDERIMDLLLALVSLRSEHHHLIVASRDAFLSRSREMQLGSDLHKITVRDLRLNPTELAIYCRRCGLQLSDEELEVLANLSEGWFSAIYLNLCSYLENRRLLTESHDIYEMMNASLLESLTPEEHEFLLKMCPAEEFTARQARYITQLPDSEEIGRRLTQNNAFVRILPDGATYRFHHMLKECMEQQLSRLPQKERDACYLRYGCWYEEQSEYLLALMYYRMAGDHRRVLRLMGTDSGVQMASLRPERVLSWLEERSPEELMTEPRSLLVLMRRLFSWRQIPKMMYLKELLLKVADRGDLPQEERSNLRGECDLIMSFLGYNDIEAMSVLHRSACSQMTRTAISIDVNNTYTFGSPSVLMMFHRQPGELDREVESMNRAMPYYYRLTNRHGAGADKIMEAEAMFLRGQFVDARIMMEAALLEAEERQQRYIVLCRDLLALRLALCGQEEYDPDWYRNRQAELKKVFDPMLMTVLDGCMAYFQAVLGDTEAIPAWLAEGQLDMVSILAPARPMFEVIRNQILLAQGRYVETAARSEKLLGLCDGFHYSLCALHVRLQTAAALEALGKDGEACEEMRKAIELAEPDGILVPFAENYRGIRCCFRVCASTEFAQQVEQVAEKLEQTRNTLLAGPRNGVFRELTDSEFKVCRLAAERRSNREIAAELFLSEGSVKQYLNHAYTKLELTGTAREKRKRLAELIKKN